MVVSLLPASAAAFAPRTAPTIVLTSVESWLTQTLRRINRIKRPSSNVSQHTRILADVLGGPDAIWSLCAIMVPREPDAQLLKSSNPLMEAFNYQLVYITAYVVHVDLVSHHEVAFKLTPTTISALIRYHRQIYLVDMAASTWDWPEKQAQIEKLHSDFVQAVNRYVFRTDQRALEGMEDRGAGELLEGRSIDAKNGILSLFMPLLPPPPEMLEVVIQAPASVPSGSEYNTWFQTVPSQITSSQTGPSIQTTSIVSSMLPSQMSPSHTHHQPELDFSTYSDLGLDMDLGMDLEAFSGSMELPSPALTMTKSQVYSTAGTPSIFPSMTTDDGYSTHLDHTIIMAMTTPSASVSPLLNPFVNLASSPTVTHPCGPYSAAAPFYDFGFVSAPTFNWSSQDTFTPHYGTAT